MAAVKRGFRAGRNEQATQENIELLTGQRGNGLDRAITLRDLASVGLAGVSKTSSGSYVISSGSGNSSSDVVIAFPTAPTGFQITGGFGSIMLRWDAPRYPGHAYTEVWRGTVETFADAALIATTPATIFGDIVNTGSSYYYWIRHVNANNRAGSYNATLGTLGKTSQDISDIIDDIGEQMRESALIEELSSSVDDINTNGSAAYQEMWSKKVSVGSITAGIGILADSEGNSQVAIAASQVFVFDPNVSDSLTPLLAVSDGVVTIPKAFIEEATIQVIQAQEITADHVSAGISIETPTITSAVINGAELNIGSGGSYDGYHTKITAQGVIYTDYLKASGGTLDNITINETCTVRGMLDGADGTFTGTVMAEHILGDIVSSRVYSTPSVTKTATSSETVTTSNFITARVNAARDWDRTLLIEVTVTFSISASGGESDASAHGYGYLYVSGDFGIFTITLDYLSVSAGEHESNTNSMTKVMTVVLDVPAGKTGSVSLYGKTKLSSYSGGSSSTITLEGVGANGTGNTLVQLISNGGDLL